MNVSDLYKFSLGQYGSVSLDSQEQLSLIGSSKYLIGAIQILSNRESSSADHSFKYLVADDGNPLYWGTHSGGFMVLQFDGTDVSSANDTIKVSKNLDFRHIRIGHTCNYWSRGQSDSSLGLTSYAIGSVNPPHSAETYHVVAKSEANGTIQLSEDAGGAVVDLTVQANAVGTRRALTFPAITSQTTALVEDALDADDQNHNATVFADGDNIVEGAMLYGRWNFVRMGVSVRAVAYLIPKMI